MYTYDSLQPNLLYKQTYVLSNPSLLPSSSSPLLTSVWKVQWSCVMKGQSVPRARILLSTSVASTSSSSITTSFFSTFMAKNFSVSFNWASKTWREWSNHSTLLKSGSAMCILQLLIQVSSGLLYYIHTYTRTYLVLLHCCITRSPLQHRAAINGTHHKERKQIKYINDSEAWMNEWMNEQVQYRE